MEILTLVIHSFDFESAIKLFLGFALAGIIGLERTSWNKPAGFRTHALVGVSAVLVVLCGEYIAKLYGTSDPTRIPAQLLSGIGFVGAGTILRDGFTVKGLTTASSLLAVTCIGLCVGSGFYFGGIFATIITYLVLSYSYLLTEKLDHFNSSELIINLKESQKETLNEIEQILENNNISIRKIDKDILANDDNSLLHETLKISIKYNNRNLTFNKVLTSITNLDNVINVEEK